MSMTRAHGDRFEVRVTPTGCAHAHAAVIWVAARARALYTYAEMIRAIVPQLKPQRAAAAARAPLASICERERARNHVLTYIEPA